MKSVFFYVFLFAWASVFAQDKETVFKVYRGSGTEVKWYLRNQDAQFGSYHYNLRGTYRYTSFLNPNYVGRIESKDLKYSWGFDTGMGFCVYPFLLDFGIMYGFYTVPDESKVSFYPTVKSKELFERGAYTSLSVFPLPNLGKMSRIFMPYMGLGYASSSLVVDNTEKEKSENIASLQISAPYWKMGVMINLGFIKIIGEYNQTMAGEKSSYFYNAGILLTLLEI